MVVGCKESKVGIVIRRQLVDIVLSLMCLTDAVT